MKPRTSHKRFGKSRKGVSTVEFAIIMPVLAILVFGSIEAAHSIQLKQGLTIAAYESAIVGTSQSSTEDQMKTRAKAIADAFQIRDMTIKTVPTITADLPSGTTVTITLSAPISSNRIGPNFFFTNRVITVSASMVRL